MPPLLSSAVTAGSAITLGTSCSAQMSRVLRVLRRGARPTPREGQDARWIPHDDRGSPRRSSGPRSTTGCAELVADPDRPTAWTLLIDGTAQSHVDLGDPTHLEFEYVRRHRSPARRAGPPAARAAARRCTSAAAPGRCPATWRRPARARCSASWSSTARWSTWCATGCPPTGWASTCASPTPGPALAEVPAGLVRRRAARRVRRRPDPGAPDLGGVPARASPGCCARAACYAANLADGAGARTLAPRRTPLDFARAQVATAAAVFAEVAVVASPDVLHGRRFGNVVLVGRNGPAR